jgi:hypothetical protein
VQHLILFIAPIAALLISFFYFKKIRITESVIAFILGVALNFWLSEWMKSGNIIDTEYLGYYIVRVEYYEDWNAWVQSTCTDSNDQQYDCSYAEYYEEYWAMVDNNGYSYRITKREYEYIVRLLKYQGNLMPVFKELNRDYYTNDGDMYYLNLPPELLFLPITRSQEYTNRIILNQSLYRYEKVSAEEKDSLGLFDYPEIGHFKLHREFEFYPVSANAYQHSTQGCDDKVFTWMIDQLNGWYGASHHLRTYVFFYPEKGREVAQKQIDYLQLGNFNELIILLGTRGKEITWCETHSWEEVPKLRTAVKQWFTVNNHTDSLLRFPVWYRQQVEAGLWTMKNYHDFDYIRVGLSLTQLIGLFLAQLALQALAIGYMFLLQRKYATLRNRPFTDEERTKYIASKRIRLVITAYVLPYPLVLMVIFLGWRWCFASALLGALYVLFVKVQLSAVKPQKKK